MFRTIVLKIISTVPLNPPSVYTMGYPSSTVNNIIIHKNTASIKNFGLNKVGKKLMNSDSLCDNSKMSEVYSGNLMHDIFAKSGYDSTLYKAESEIKYSYNFTKKTDYILRLSQKDNLQYDEICKIAVEVKRIHNYNNKIVNDNYITTILNKANIGAIESNKYVSSINKWDTQYLHVLTSCDNVYNCVIDWAFGTEYCGFSQIYVTVIVDDNNIIF